MPYDKTRLRHAWRIYIAGRCAALRIIAAGLAAIFALSSAAAAGTNDEPVVQAQVTTMSAMRAYWTVARMKDAKPVPLRRILRSPASVPTSFGAMPTGPAVIANSGGPGDPPTERVVDHAEMFTLGIEPQASPGPFAFTGYRLFPNAAIIYQQFPYSQIGKIFFTISGQGDFVCSGTVVNAPNLSLVWTAGHCVYSAGIGFHTNFIFVPARHEGVNPRAQWTANTLGAPAGWTDNDLLEYDFGAAFMNPGGPGAGNFLIGQFGYLGFAANLPRRQHWHVQGYPSEPPFDGEHHHLCAASWGINEQPTGVPGTDPPTIGLGCNMTAGSSGGAWVLDLKGQPGSGNIVNGNISYGYIGLPNRLYGPYYGDAAIALRDMLGNM